MRSLSRTLPARALTAALGLAVGLGLAAAPSYADRTTPVPADATSITIFGEGAGHGHGLSQYGANAAAKRGLSTDAILRHYYPGTRTGTAGGQVRVLLSTDPVLVVATRSGLRAGVVGGRTWKLTHARSKAARKAKRWRISAVSATRSRLSYRKGSRWVTYRTVTGQLQFSAGGKPIRLIAGTDSGTFRGMLRSARTSANTADRDIVNVVPLEAYVKGVVPNEMPALWAPAAVRAQAVAARSYVAYQRANEHRGWFDVYDSTLSQVYRGAGSEHPAASRAVEATKHRILTFGGRPAFTEFSSSNGGWMLAGSKPYLVSGRDVYDPVNTWTKTLPMSAFEARFPSWYPFRSIGVTTYRNAGGWVETVTITSEDGTTHPIEGDALDAFRSWAGLKSGSFRFSR